MPPLPRGVLLPLTCLWGMTAMAHPAMAGEVGVFCLESERMEQVPEVETGPEPPRAYTLRVWQGDGARSLIVENVKFPGPLHPLPGGRP